MKNNLKKLLCAALSAAMAAGMVVLPTTAGAADYTPIFEGDTVLKEWKFDFGAADSTAEDGYTLVTPDTNFTANTGGEYQYGFLGTDAEDYNLTNRYDGWTTQKGQTIELAAGGGTGLNDAVGVIGAGGTGENEGKDVFGNQADKYYPTRFALKVEDDTYYRIRATVTTLDPTKDATVSLYTERKHPIYTERTISAGEADTIEFSVRVTPIYYEKSAPTGTIADEMVTVGVLGENSALAAVEIQQVESYPTVWVLGDSTVTDGNTTLPFFTLQNYTGVGTGLTKYLPRDMAMVNEGEGGLNAADNYHFNMVKNRIKSGDYMYVEYGHNHKSDGPSGYKSHLDKYYNACHEVGAKLIIVSPVQSVNSWNTNTNKWDDRFGGENNFEGAGRSYVEEKVAGGATDVAFVNLTKTSVEFVDKVTADNGNVKTAAQFYYQTSKGGGTDSSHPNDAGAENFAYCFFEAAKEVIDETQAAVLKPILDNMTDEMPNLVSQEIIDGGIGGTAWPQYIVPTSEKYPVLINDVIFNEDGTVKQVDVTTRAAEISMAGTYGVVIITIYNPDGTEKGKIYAVDQVDNSTGYGSQTIVNFRGDVTLEEGDTFSAVVVEADADTNPVEGGKIYSAVYKITEIEEQLLVNERNEEKYENFDYYGVKYDGTVKLDGQNSWKQIGSAVITSNLNQTSEEMKYTELTSTGKKAAGGDGSFYYSKELVKEIGTTGRYLISADMQYVSGGGMTFNLVTGHSDKTLGGTESQYLFTVGADGKITVGSTEAGQISPTSFTNVEAVLDMDMGMLEVTVFGNDTVKIPLDNYNTTSTEVKPSKLTQFMFGGSKVAFDVKVANLQVAKLKNKQLPLYTATAKSSDSVNGYATVVDGAGIESDVEIAYFKNAADDEDPLHKDGMVQVISHSQKPVNAEGLIVYRDENGVIQGTPENFGLSSSGISGGNGVASGQYINRGAEIYMWDWGLKKLQPMTDKIIANEETVLTKPINTTVTYKAVPALGYVFMGWQDNDNNVVSIDTSYTVRLRGDMVLTAKIVTAPSIENITTFEVSASPTGIKAKAGSKAEMKVSNAKDANGTPLDSVTSSDITWSCGEAGITIDENGVLTIGDEFNMGGNLTKEVTITGTLNGVSKTCKLTLFAYEYFENMAEGATLFDGVFMQIAGKTAIVFPGSKVTSKYTMTEPVKLDAVTTVKFDHVWSGQNTCGQKRTLQFKNSSGTTIFSVYYDWTGLRSDKDNIINGAVEKDSYKTVTAVIDPTTKIVTVSVDGVDGALTVPLADNAGDIVGIDFVSDNSVPEPTARALGISNLTIIK